MQADVRGRSERVDPGRVDIEEGAGSTDRLHDSTFHGAEGSQAKASQSAFHQCELLCSSHHCRREACQQQLSVHYLWIAQQDT